ncbi:SUMO-specific isopeptidase USPL1 isoform X4 [Ambystoma mexicanum]|uniref:SUMO-specific isopeptidase USPL1 isoform X4 n=1 Tax=Ambystoma mexicanum TaxID=8296 RepID=UPI0037E9BD37
MGEEETSKQVYESCKVTSDACPACKLKGLTHPLQVYRISFKESIILCENPQCIYPLGHKPLHSITTSARDLINQQTKHSPRKRKSFECSPRVPLKKSPSRSIGQCVEKVNTIPVRSPDTSLCTSLGQNGNISEKRSLASNGLSGEPSIHVHSGSLEDSVAEENSEAPQNSIFDTEVVSEKATCSKSQTLCNKVLLPKLQGRTLHLQWRNEDALCWLDCILSSFVNLRTLREAIEVSTEEHSILKQLFSKYDHANALQTYVYGKDGNIAEISLEVLVQAEKQLNEIRLEVFNLLQPQLKCQLGKNDMPVFALPLLLKKDPSFQNLFMHSFAWKFECLLCGYKSQDRCSKTLTTFTKVFPEWHPLHAVHVAPCNNCLDQSQRREMVLEKVPAVFMLHFSEGLPHGNLKDYSFQFEGGSYEVTVVIQYQTNHFATWVLTPDGSWLECDDLKGPYCQYHDQCEVPASEIHIVFWEKNKSACRLNSQFQCENAESLPFICVRSSSPVHCDCVVDQGGPAAFLKVNTSNAPSTEPLDLTNKEGKSVFGFKNSTDDAIITLTLVEIHVDSEGRLLQNDHVVGIDDTGQQDTLQPQEKACAYSLKTSCQGVASPETIVANECLHSQCSSVCTLIRMSNTSGTTVPEILVGGRNDFQGSLVLTNEEPQISPFSEEKQTGSITGGEQENTNVVETEIASSPPPDSKRIPKSELASNWVSCLGQDPTLLFSPGVSNQKSKLSNSKYNIEQRADDVQQRHLNESSLKAKERQFPVKGASSFGGFKAKGINKSSDDEITVPPLACGEVSLPPELTNVAVLAAEPFSSAENEVPTGDASIGSIQTMQDKAILIALNESSKYSDILNGNRNLLSNDFVKEHNIHKLRLQLLSKLKAKKNVLAS